MTPAETLLVAASRAKLVIAAAESCTGGLIGAAITEVAGSSDIFDRGFITYSDASKTEILGVAADTIAAHGAVSEQVARAMALGALARSHAAVAVAVTGVAGPGGSADKPEGRVCFALAGAEGVVTETVDFGALGRQAVRQATVEHALMLLTEVARGG